jgi:biotin operon repressor
VTNTQNKTNALCEYLKKNHTGRKNGAQSKTLEVVLDIKNREVRKCVNTLRCNGFPVCSDEAGYYYAASQLEIDNTISRLNSLITKISNAKNGLLNSKIKNMTDIVIEIKLSVG